MKNAKLHINLSGMSVAFGLFIFLLQIRLSSSCSSPSYPPNCAILGLNPAYDNGQSYALKCINGYIKFDDGSTEKTITCRSDGTWTGIPAFGCGGAAVTMTTAAPVATTTREPAATTKAVPVKTTAPTTVTTTAVPVAATAPTVAATTAVQVAATTLTAATTTAVPGTTTALTTMPTAASSATTATNITTVVLTGTAAITTNSVTTTTTIGIPSTQTTVTTVSILTTSTPVASTISNGKPAATTNPTVGIATGSGSAGPAFKPQFTTGPRKPTIVPLPMDPCLSSTCDQNATCVSHSGVYQCQCLSTRVGVRCDVTIIGACDGGLCKRGSTGCYVMVNGSRYCECASGFYGSQCELEVDECLSSPCLNGASCVNGIDGFRCTCALGWTGALCEFDIDECASHPCRMNGTCSERGPGSHHCECLIGFTGQSCEINIDECVGISCLHGGHCVDGVSNYACDCPTQNFGTHCEALSAALRSTQNAATSLGVIAALAIVDLFAVVLLMDVTRLYCQQQLGSIRRTPKEKKKRIPRRKKKPRMSPIQEEEDEEEQEEEDKEEVADDLRSSLEQPFKRPEFRDIPPHIWLYLLTE